MTAEDGVKCCSFRFSVDTRSNLLTNLFILYKRGKSQGCITYEIEPELTVKFTQIHWLCDTDPENVQQNAVVNY